MTIEMFFINNKCYMDLTASIYNSIHISLLVRIFSVRCLLRCLACVSPAPADGGVNEFTSSMQMRFENNLHFLALFTPFFFSLLLGSTYSTHCLFLSPQIRISGCTRTLQLHCMLYIMISCILGTFTLLEPLTLSITWPTHLLI